MSTLSFLVSDLVDRPGERRAVSGSIPLSLTVGECTVDAVTPVEAVIEGIASGVLVRFEAAVDAHLTCTRCLATWDESLSVSAVQVFEPEPDDDGYSIDAADVIDLSGPVRDEAALVVPLRPLCRPNCLGLCPTCGNDLNSDPCDGHEEESVSPFGALRELFGDDELDSRVLDGEEFDRDVSKS